MQSYNHLYQPAGCCTNHNRRHPHSSSILIHPQGAFATVPGLELEELQDLLRLGRTSCQEMSATVRKIGKRFWRVNLVTEYIVQVYCGWGKSKEYIHRQYIPPCTACRGRPREWQRPFARFTPRRLSGWEEFELFASKCMFFLCFFVPGYLIFVLHSYISHVFTFLFLVRDHECCQLSKKTVFSFRKQYPQMDRLRWVRG